MGRVATKRAAGYCEAETDDSGFGSNLSPPFAKNFKLEDDSSPAMTTLNSWPFDGHGHLAALQGSGGHQLHQARPKATLITHNENFVLGEGSLFNICPNKHSSKSRDGKIELRLLTQPEEQHRARYMTEGSRGAIKDRSGLSHPVIRLYGVSIPVKVECYIGHDKQIGLPHLFYQASKINGKNSTKCTSTKIEGTSVITFELLPQHNMQAVVDCVGILKERNVDVEHKMQRLRSRGDFFNLTKKRSTKCRMVFRCRLPETDEILMVVSSPILCTQPAGCPEIAKKSLVECNVAGGQEIFIIGKNFVKDSKLVWKGNRWLKVVEPNKEFLHSTHMVCPVPAYDGPELQLDLIPVSLFVKNSDGKSSETHAFFYKRKPNLAVSTATVDSFSEPGHLSFNPCLPCNESSILTKDSSTTLSSTSTLDMATASSMANGASSMIPISTMVVSQQQMACLNEVPMTMVKTEMQANQTDQFGNFYQQQPGPQMSQMNSFEGMPPPLAPPMTSMTGNGGEAFQTFVAPVNNTVNEVNSMTVVTGTQQQQQQVQQQQQQQTQTQQQQQQQQMTLVADVNPVVNSYCERSAVPNSEQLIHSSASLEANPQSIQQSLNAISQMSESELLRVLNPSTFDQCV